MRAFRLKTQAENDDRLRELEQHVNEKLREEKLRQAIRENSTDLRDLRQKLNHAYVNKERMAQIKEHEVERKRQNVFVSKNSSL